MDFGVDYETDSTEVLENEMDNQRDNIDHILESMSVIDKQNLVTSYVMTCYNLLYPASEALARFVMAPPGQFTLRPDPVSVSKGKQLFNSVDDPRLPLNHTNFIKFEINGPTDWDQTLFENPFNSTLILGVSPSGVTVHHSLKSSSTPINDDVEEAQNVIIDETRERQALARGEIIPIHSDNADVLVPSPPSDASSISPDIHHLPTKNYIVSSETLNTFKRSNDYKTVSADSLITFGVRVDSDPRPEPSDISCEMKIKVGTIARYQSGYCLLDSVTQIEATKTQGTVVKQVRDQSLVVSFAQPMNREFAELMIDGIANNYTAVVQIIGLALILYFSQF